MGAVNRNRLINQALRIGNRALRRWGAHSAGSGGTRRGDDVQHGRHRRDESPSPAAYPGDFTGRPTIEYDPVKDDEADPGEVVWTWVPFEEDPAQGKDRPVLVIGHDGEWLLVLQLSTVGDPDERQREAGRGRHWVDIGAGAWDSRGRESEVRVNRIIRIRPDTVRRIGARLDPGTYRDVARQVLQHY